MLVDRSPQRLLEVRTSIIEFLRSHLRLELKLGDQLAPVEDGIDYLGYIIHPHYRLVRRRVIGHLRQRLHQWQVSHIKITTRAGTLQLGEAADSLRQTLASYLGHFAHAHTYRLRQQIEAQYPWLQQLFFQIHPRLIPRWQQQARRRPSMAGQWSDFHRAWPEHVILIQKGARVALPVGVWKQWLQRHAPLLRQHAAWMLQVVPEPTKDPRWVTWPLSARPRIERVVLDLGEPLIWVAEQGWQRTGLKRRVAQWRKWPITTVTPMPLIPTIIGDGTRRPSSESLGA